MTHRLVPLVGRGVMAVTGLLVTLVALVGGVALVAEFQRTWRWYFRMEQIAGAAVEPALALSALSMFGYVTLVTLVGE